MTVRRAFLAASACGLLLPRSIVAQAATIDAMRFSSLKPGSPLPAEYRVQTFEKQPRHTEYTLVEDAGRTVLRARADASTSGIARALRIDPATHPLLAWRWKVTRLLAKSDLATKAGDDFPARLYVSFDLDVERLLAADRMRIGLARMIYGADLPVGVLCYVWDRSAPAGTFAPNAYTDRVRMIVADSGPARLGQWVEHERNVAEDFRRAFSLEAPAVTGVIVSTDTDNTGETAESYYGDVIFRPRRPA